MKYICPQDVCILEALRTLFPQSSANTLRSWIKAGRISVNSRTVFKANLELSKGAIIEVGPKVSFIDKQIKVFYEDEELIVIEKPQGLLSVATDYDKSHSLHALLKKRFHKQRVFPVHRLDRETSGVMLFAYSDYARQHLKEQFATRCVEKTYYAIVSGTLSPQKGVWESYLQEDASYHVIEGGERLAITHYEILAAKKDYKLLALKPITGRKHQLRVHCQKAGVPIVGDKRYAGMPAKHLYLHAHKIAFVHPTKNKKMLFTSPIPSFFNDLVLS